MKTLGYYNGAIGEIEDMVIPMNDRVCWFGDGVYDAGPCHNYHIFAMEEHIDRFFNSAGLMKIRMPVTKQELGSLLQELVLKMDTGDLFVYVQVTRGTGPRNHVFTEGCGNLWITLTPAGVLDGTVPLQLITVEDTRFFHCNVKTLNLLPSVLASEKARQAGCQEAIFYRPGGRVTECAHSNVHIIQDGMLRTAPTDNLILPGIARAHLIRMCKKLEIPARLDQSIYAQRFVLIPFKAVGTGAGLLEGLRTDYICFGGKKIEKAVLAFYDGDFGEAEALMNREVLNYEILENDTEAS